LENPEDTEQLLSIVSNKIYTANTTKINLTSELKKLRAIKIWATISKKILIDNKDTKFTMSFVREMKLLI